MKLQYTRVSVVVRTYNEETFIQQVLQQIRNQNGVEIEIILVDNKSDDGTVALADPFVDRILSIDEFKPGAALNLGIRCAKYENIAIISGHCVPIGQLWLSKLVAPLADLRIAGVYGRQIPTNASSAYDKRDLWTTFGIESRFQTKDPFFHNANSALTKLTWDRFPFNEVATNVEDRIWAKQVLENGQVLKYEADAIVNHWHGINHGGNLSRAENVVRVLTQFEIYNESH